MPIAPYPNPPQHTRRNILRLLALGAPGLLLACGAAPTRTPAAPGGQDGTPRRGGTFTIVQTSDVLGFDPAKLPTGNYTMIGQLYNVLARYDPQLQPQPELAESWKLSEDGTSLQLNLRKGVVFHSGREMTAADVAFSLDWVKDPKHGANVLPLAQLVTTVDMLDPYTAVLRFKAPNPAIFDLLDLLYILDKDHAGDIDHIDAGTGPFRLKEWTPGDHATFVRNDRYWRTPALLDRVELRVVPDAQAQVVQFESGAANYADRIRTEDYIRLKADARFKTGTAAVGSGVFDFILNLKRTPFDNPMVRETMDLALDRARIANTLLGTGTEPACLPFPKSSIAYDATLAASCRFDLDAARAKLSAAGMSGGSDITLTTSSATAPELGKMAQIYQSDLAKIGVRAKIEDVDSQEWFARVREGRFDVLAHSFGRANKDPASLFGTATIWKPDNPEGYRSDRYTMLIAQGASTVDPAKRHDIYQQLAAIVRADRFVLPVAPNLLPWASKAAVAGLDWNVEGMLLLEKASVGS